uniref:MAP kinase-activating death domain protein n=1 Tax=Strongyloides papillosus TaxID=174720 RepID=A0A0N5CCS5_STREA
MDDKNKELCPRLLDYVVMVGRRENTKFESQPLLTSFASHEKKNILVSNPSILRRYPSDDHKDFALPLDVTCFCQPEGCVTLVSRKKWLQRKEISSFVFTLTEKDSAKIRYGVSLNFYLSSPQPIEINYPSIPKEPNTSGPIRVKKRISLSHLTSICIISHHPFLSGFREIANLLRKIIIAANCRCNKNENIPKNAVWSILLGYWDSSYIPEEVMKEIRDIETWILMVLSSPVPVPGKTKVELELLPKEFMPMLTLALPDHTRFSLVDFPLHLPLELLGIETTLKLLSAVMLEYKVILQSTNYNAVSMCVMALVALMYPLEYMFPVIPLLPSYMPSAENILLAPTPFIIGLPSSFFAFKNIEVPNDVILVDLDTNEINIPEDMEIPEFPQPERDKLKYDLEVALGKAANRFQKNGDRKLIGELDEDEIDIGVRVAMINFYNSSNIFLNFSEHTRTLRLYPRPVVALQIESFLQSRPFKSQFIKDLCMTQSVEYFAECSLCPRNETYVRVQTGIQQASQIGDKAKWFHDNLMPIHFLVYPDNSTIKEALEMTRKIGTNIPNESEAEESSSEVEGSNVLDELCRNDDTPESDKNSEVKPIAHVNHIFCPPSKLEIPDDTSIKSFGSSPSSGRSTPDTESDTSALDSELDFARMAKNMVLKRNDKGHMTFENETSMMGNNDNEKKGSEESYISKPSKIIRRPQIKAFGMRGLQTMTDSGEKMLGPNFMNTLNGFTERSSDMLSQMISKTTPKAQALKEKTMRPLQDVTGHGSEQEKSDKESNLAASKQNKNQQIIKDTCDQILNGNSIGVFTFPKVKRLMEDESLRELVCQKLNLGLSIKYTEEEYEQHFKLTKAQYKGYLKILQACIQGLETSFNANGSSGLASMLHVLEIAHCAFLFNSDGVVTPNCEMNSAITTPSSTNYKVNFHEEHTLVKLPATSYDTRENKSSLDTTTNDNEKKSQRNVEIVVSDKKDTPPPIPPRPPRPPPPRQESLVKNNLAKININTNENSTLLGITKNDEDGERTPKVLNPNEPKGPVCFTPLTNTNDKINPNGQLPHLPRQTNPPKSLVLPRRFSGTQDNNYIQTPTNASKHFLYIDLIGTSNPLWQNMTFWENGFFDVVAQERDKIGMDQEPSELIDRYSSLSDTEKKRLELDEDRILATLLHNMTAYMVMCGTNKKLIQQKVRRLLGKAHIGLIYSKKINQLLDQLPNDPINEIPLKPLVSRLMQKQSFAVHIGSDNDCQLAFMEVCDDAVVLRAVTGSIIERWWYERLVNMTYSPKTRVLCIWRKKDDQVYMHKFFTKKCRQLYNCMKAAMERAAARGKVTVAGRDLEGEFPVHDTTVNQGGLLTVRIDGIKLTFSNWNHFIDLKDIKKCNTFGGNQFMIEEFNREKQQLEQRRFYSNMARDIVWNLHRIFSIITTLCEELPKKEFEEKGIASILVNHEIPKVISLDLLKL